MSETLPSRGMSMSCRSALILVARIFQKVNDLILKEVTRDQVHYYALDENETASLRRYNQQYEILFSGENVGMPESARKLRIPGRDEDIAGLLVSLSDTNYISI
jgi:hypothetical protein